MVNIMKKYILKIMFCIVITLITLILLKGNNQFKTRFYKYVYDTNFSFASINKWYQNKFGSPIPFEGLFQTTEPVFNETLKYYETSKYLEGVSLTVDMNYLVPALEDGIVIFIGEKEEYGNTVIVQQSNGIDVWYSNLNVTSVSLYDYIKKGSLIGEVNSNLYLKFVKDGKVLDYKEYI